LHHAFNRVVALNDIGELALFVGHHEGAYSATVIGEGQLRTLGILQNEKVGELSSHIFLKGGLTQTAQILIII
jgi:hypothetical protein